MKAYTSEQLVGIFEDQRDLKNLMGKLCYTILLKQEDQMISRFWSAQEDICLGTNRGWYLGREAVSGYYSAVYRHTAEATAFLKKAFPDRMEKLTEQEQFGAGSMDVKPMDTAVIEIAGTVKAPVASGIPEAPTMISRPKGLWHSGSWEFTPVILSVKTVNGRSCIFCS